MLLFETRFSTFACEEFVAYPSNAEDHRAILVEVHTVVLVSVQVLEDEVHLPLVVAVLHRTEILATFGRQTI